VLDVVQSVVHIGLAMFTPVENKPLCDRCLNDDRDGALRARGDMLLCVGCWEGWLSECNCCGREVPELTLVDSRLLEGERYCPWCAELEQNDCSCEDDSTVREGFEE